MDNQSPSKRKRKNSDNNLSQKLPRLEDIKSTSLVTPEINKVGGVTRDDELSEETCTEEEEEEEGEGKGCGLPTHDNQVIRELIKSHSKLGHRYKGFVVIY